jgi:hypothetical protein
MGEFYGKAEALDLIKKAQHQTFFTDTQKHVLTFLTQTFNDNKISFQATGGLAAIAYGATRPLYDIDIDIYKNDVEKVRSLLKQYIVEDWNNELEGDEDSFDLWMMTLDMDGVSIDISQLEESHVRKIGGDWVAQPEIMDIEMRTVEGIELPIQNKQHLIEYKLLIARDTDLEDVEQMQV